MKRYILEGYVSILAGSDEEAERLFDEAGLGIHVKPIDDVEVTFEGPWTEIEELEEEECTCPPELLARGGFRGGCPKHG